MGSGGSVLDKDPGIIPRVMEEIFKRTHTQEEEARSVVTVSFLELYMEELRDLLHAPGPLDETKRPAVSVRENVNGQVEVCGATERVVCSLAEMGNCLAEGSKQRTTSATKMNDESSRSHAIFTIGIEQHHADGELTTSHFHLVDLAGSERAKRTEATGHQFDEGVTINQSLFALGNVISALGDDAKRAMNAHVPYRDSKLTRMLQVRSGCDKAADRRGQNSLGGNSRTVMIACVSWALRLARDDDIVQVSPADDSSAETENTLRYANRARNIKNKPVKNMDPHKAQLAGLRNQLKDMQDEMAKMREGGGGRSDAELVAQIQLLQKQLDDSQGSLESVRTELVRAQADKSQMELLLEQSGVAAESDEAGESLGVIERYVEKIQQQELMIVELQDQLVGEDEAEQPEAELTQECAEREASLSKMEAEMATLEAAMKSTEDEIDTLSHPAGISLAQFQELEKEVNSLQAERDDLITQLDKKKQLPNSEEQKKRLEQKVAQLEKQMKEARKKQDEFKRMQNQKVNAERRLQEARNELDVMKQKKVSLSKKLADDASTFREWKATHNRQVTQLKRESQKKEYELSKMKSMQLKTAAVLKRKMEEVASVSKRLKQMSAEVSAARKASKPISGSSQPGNTSSQAVKANRRSWLEKEVSLASTMFTAKQTLEKELQEKQLQMHELAMLKRQVFALKKREAPEESIERLENTVSSIEKQLEAKQGSIQELQNVITAGADEPASRRWDHVKQLDEARIYLKMMFTQLVQNSIETRQIRDDASHKQEAAATVECELRSQIDQMNELLAQRDQQIADLKSKDRTSDASLMEMEKIDRIASRVRRLSEAPKSEANAKTTPSEDSTKCKELEEQLVGLQKSYEKLEGKYNETCKALKTQREATVVSNKFLRTKLEEAKKGDTKKCDGTDKPKPSMPWNANHQAPKQQPTNATTETIAKIKMKPPVPTIKELGLVKDSKPAPESESELESEFEEESSEASIGTGPEMSLVSGV